MTRLIELPPDTLSNSGPDTVSLPSNRDHGDRKPHQPCLTTLTTFRDHPRLTLPLICFPQQEEALQSAFAGKDDVDESTFSQILEMDEEGDHEFSRGIVFDFFSQAENTFNDIEAGLYVLSLA